MPGLVPGIHVFMAANKKDVDGRVKPGHDSGENYRGTTAVASISTRAAFSTRRTTCTSAIAG